MQHRRTVGPARRAMALAALVALAGCAGMGGAPERIRHEPPVFDAPEPLPPRNQAPGQPQPINHQAEATFHILVGELALRRNLPDVAARAFLSALRSVPELELAVRATQLALQVGDEDLALQAAELWLQLEPNALDAREVVLRVHLLNDRTEQALPQALAVVDGYAAGPAEGFRHLGLLLARVPQDQSDSAIALMQAVIDRRTEPAGGALALGSLALRFNEIELAESAAERAMHDDPKDHSGLLLMAGIRIRQGALDEAITLAERAFSGQTPSVRAELKLAFARLLLESGATEEARALLLRVQKDDPELDEAQFLLAQMALREGSLGEAIQRFQSLAGTALHQPAAMQLGRIAEVGEHYEEALGYYSAVTRGGLAVEAANRRAVVLIRMDRREEALELIQRLREELPGVEKPMLLLEVELLVEQRQLQDAITLLSDALEQQPFDADLRYARAIAFERIGQLELAEQDLRQILEENDAEARTLNALGYLLVLEGTRLDEARPMIEQALALEPEDPAIMDTKGWLLFKEGDLEGALHWLERAHAAFPDPEVAAHLGEVLWVLGRTEDAREVWKRAQAVDRDHPVLQETLQRLAPEL